MKTVLIFKCNTLLKSDVIKQIREDLKRQIDEGVVVTDIRFDYVKTMLPKKCEYEVVVETIEEENIYEIFL